MAKQIFEKPSVTADILVERENKLLLIQRKHEPYQGYWALPGGFLEVGKESVKQTAKRELYEETRLITRLEDLELIGETSLPSRDPRGHIVSLVYVAKKYFGAPKARDDAEALDWYELGNLPRLAFDHEEMIDMYIRWRNKNETK